MIQKMLLILFLATSPSAFGAVGEISGTLTIDRDVSFNNYAEYGSNKQGYAFEDRGCYSKDPVHVRPKPIDPATYGCYMDEVGCEIYARQTTTPVDIPKGTVLKFSGVISKQQDSSWIGQSGIFYFTTNITATLENSSVQLAILCKTEHSENPKAFTNADINFFLKDTLTLQ